MRLPTDIEKKLEKLIEVQQSHQHKPKTCPTCGQQNPIYDTWILGDYSYISGEITALEWVLGKIEQLTEDHT